MGQRLGAAKTAIDILVIPSAAGASESAFAYGPSVAIF